MSAEVRQAKRQAQTTLWTFFVTVVGPNGRIDTMRADIPQSEVAGSTRKQLVDSIIAPMFAAGLREVKAQQ